MSEKETENPKGGPNIFSRLIGTVRKTTGKLFQVIGDVVAVPTNTMARFQDIFSTKIFKVIHNISKTVIDIHKKDGKLKMRLGEIPRMLTGIFNKKHRENNIEYNNLYKQENTTWGWKKGRKFWKNLFGTPFHIAGKPIKFVGNAVSIPFSFISDIGKSIIGKKANFLQTKHFLKKTFKRNYAKDIEKQTVEKKDGGEKENSGGNKDGEKKEPKKDEEIKKGNDKDGGENNKDGKNKENSEIKKDEKVNEKKNLTDNKEVKTTNQVQNLENQNGENENGGKQLGEKDNWKNKNGEGKQDGKLQKGNNENLELQEKQKLENKTGNGEDGKKKNGQDGKGDQNQNKTQTNSTQTNSTNTNDLGNTQNDGINTGGKTNQIQNT